MYGCIGRIAVLCGVLLLGVVAYLTRDRWEPQLMSRLSGRRASSVAWEPVTPEGATRTRAALDTLARPTGAAFVNVAPADVVAYALNPVLLHLAPADRDAAGPAARAEVGLLLLRGNIRMADLGGAAALGPLAGVLEGPQRIEVRGSVEVPAPGRAYFVVSRISIGDLVIPAAALGAIVQQIAPRRDRTQSETAVALTLPASVADVRIRPGRVTLYRAAR